MSRTPQTKGILEHQAQSSDHRRLREKRGDTSPNPVWPVTARLIGSYGVASAPSAPFVDRDALDVSHPAVVPVEIVGRSGDEDVDLRRTPEMRLVFLGTLVEPVRQFFDRIVALFLDVIGDGRAEDGDSSEKLVLVVENILQLSSELHVFGPDRVFGVLCRNNAPSFEDAHDAFVRLESVPDAEGFPRRFFLDRKS